MTDSELKILADELQYIFVRVNTDIPSNNGLSARTNKILAFEKYAQNMDFHKIRKYCSKLCESDMPRLKEIIKNNIAKYLADNVKTLAIY